MIPPLVDLERELLLRLQGVQLVCELGIDVDDPLFDQCHRALNSYLDAHHVGHVSSNCPALFVLVMTVLGAELGTGGELWERIYAQDSDGLYLSGLEPSNASRYGQQFRESLSRIGLPEFSHVGGMRNLSPILLHAGIPRHSAEVVWRKVLEYVREGTTSGREIVQDLRSDRQQLRYFNKPAERFIREAGPFAIDMIQRMANVVVSTLEDPELSPDVLGSRHGLPTRFIEALEGSLLTHNVDALRIPSADIYLDFTGGLGPYCLIPPVREQSAEVMWTVCGRNYRASRFDEKCIQLAPSAAWSVEATAHGRRLRARITPSLGDGGIWLFAESRTGLRAVRTSDGLEEGRYYLLAPKATQVRVVRDGVEFNAALSESVGLGDAWSQHQILELNLSDAKAVHICRRDEQQSIETTLSVEPAPLRASLEGAECVGIHEIDGLRVFSEPPRLTFSGRVKDTDKFFIRLRTHDGTWTERSLVTEDVVDNAVDLGRIVSWETGEYRLEVVGPMGSGMSETFVLLLDGRLTVTDRLLMPTERVPVSLGYRKDTNSELTLVQEDSVEFEYRKYCSPSDRSFILVMTIPRISFDIGGVDSPPEFSRPDDKVLTVEDLQQPVGQRLYVRTGIPAELQLVATDAEGMLVHAQTVVTSGHAASAAVDVGPVLESIRYLGSKTTTIELVSQAGQRLRVLTIQQELDFRISNFTYVMSDDALYGALHVDVEAKTDSANVRVCIQSLDRVWDAALVSSLTPAIDSKTRRSATFHGVAPGRYSAQLAIGPNVRPIPSTRREWVIGTTEQRGRYLTSLRSQPDKLAERVVSGELVARKSLVECTEEDLGRIVLFFVTRHRFFSTEAPEFQATLRCISSEGNSRFIATWMTQMGADEASTQDLELFVLRLFSVFLDDPITGQVERDETSSDDVILVSRLWAISSIIGYTFTYRMSNEIVRDHIENLGSNRRELDYEALAALSWPELELRLQVAEETSQIMGEGYALTHFRHTWQQCWTSAGPSQARLEELERLNAAGKSVLETALEASPAAYPDIIASTLPAQHRPGRQAENLAIAKFIHNLFRLAWLAARVETPQEAALRACEVLGTSYGFAKGMTDRALMTAITIERMSRG